MKRSRSRWICRELRGLGQSPRGVVKSAIVAYHAGSPRGIEVLDSLRSTISIGAKIVLGSKSYQSAKLYTDDRGRAMFGNLLLDLDLKGSSPAHCRNLGLDLRS